MNLNNIDLNKVAVFCQIMDSGNYKTASDVLNVTPSALSQTISILEHSLGFALFHRIGKKLIPTESGQNLYREFRSSYNRFNEALNKIATQKNEIQGSIVIGAYLEFAKTKLAPIVGRYLKLHPQTQIKFLFDTPTRLHRMLENGQIDLCFSIFPSNQNRIINSRQIFREELVLIAPKGLLNSRPTYKDVIQSSMIEYYGTHQPIRKWIEIHFKKKPKHLPIRTFASTAEMVLALVKAQVGVGIIPKFILNQHAADAVTIVRPSEKQFVDHIWMLERNSSHPRPIQISLSHFVQNHLNLS